MGKKKSFKEKKAAAHTHDPTHDKRNKNPPIKLGFISEIYIEYYKQILVPTQMTEEEFNQMIEIYKSPLPIVFRLNPRASNHDHLVSKIDEFFSEFNSKGISATKYNELPDDCGRIYKLILEKAQLRQNPEFQSFRDFLKLQTDIGNFSRQEFVSMIPPTFLDIQPSSLVLDTCAAPGSKTAQIIEKLGPNGGVVANDADPRRCHPLVHQLQRVGTSNVLVTCNRAQSFRQFGTVKFDRVLCDVPCSGDGTFRKNASAANKWKPSMSIKNHGIQRGVLRRGLELLKVGGRLVYSTCSMNPLENEAVLNSVIREVNEANPNSVALVDVSKEFPELKRHPGLTTWPVYDTALSELHEYPNYEAVPPERRQYVNSTMFPQPTIPNLEYSMRFYPQDSDSGGFFVAVLTKTAEIQELSHDNETPPKGLKESPYIPILLSAPQQAEEIKEMFGLKTDFPMDQLFVRDESHVRNVYYTSAPIAQLIRDFGSEPLRTISCGTRIFTWKPLRQKVMQNHEKTSENTENTEEKASEKASEKNTEKETEINIQNERKDKISMPYPAADGVMELMPFMTKRKFALKPEEMRDLLAAGHYALPYTSISEESYAPMRDDHSGTPGAVFYIPGTPFAYGGLTFAASFTIYLNKDLIDVELGKLALMYPDMAPGIRITSKPTKQEINQTNEIENEEDKNENEENSSDTPQDLN